MIPVSPQRRAGTIRLAAVIGALALAACSASELAGPVPEGTWGGPQGTLVVYADSATLDLFCAAGRIQGPLATDSAGAFDRPGSYSFQAGPIGIGAIWQPARFIGKRSADTIELRIEVSSFEQAIGPLKFKRGVTAQIPGCPIV